MRLIQYTGRDGASRVGCVDTSGVARTIRGMNTTFEIATNAINRDIKISEFVEERLTDESESVTTILEEKRIRAPFHHPDPQRQILTGTGLSHLGSASARDSMHTKLNQPHDDLTDSMKMFKLGLDGGKPQLGKIGAQPEWFYKGDGGWVVNPESSLESPNFALDGGEEVEIVGIYMIDPKENVRRVGFALANEFSDHVMEKQNYLYLAHSKLRQCSFGPELLLGDLPDDVRGRARLVRDGIAIWEDTWLSGNNNMCHSISNLEHHHFKYKGFTRPGDVHIHFFGAATGSFTKQVEAQPGDVFEIESPTFGSPLRNTLAKDLTPEETVKITSL